ncbi:hypothetical protein L210DRAFT_3518828 [Boletus edulis BED1]|uniref:Uncharacterized protein n=1 Tax=Boletus edulis BED1 TaxID=1328754 RepID=A0AAD4GNA1_BOLED|nr:hypothetical protein L210DRAFT_3518828 [Boletus edulis BED1]
MEDFVKHSSASENRGKSNRQRHGSAGRPIVINRAVTIIDPRPAKPTVSPKRTRTFVTVAPFLHGHHC